MNWFSALFLALFLATLGFKLWLVWRQVRHVRAHRPHVPAAFAERIALPAHQTAADYTIARAKPSVVEALIGDGALVLALTVGGGLAALNAWSLGLTGNPYWQVLALFAALFILQLVVGLPFEIYRTFVTEARFGFNRTTPGLFIADQLKGLALLALLGTPLVLAITWFFTAAGPLWWLYSFVLWVLFSLLMVRVAAPLLMPIFNTFTPFPEGDTKRRVEALLARQGFAVQGLFVMDGSKRSSHGNAFFIGFGKGKRVVFYDTLLARLTDDEIEAVLAHELGHYHHGHIWKGMLTSFAAAFIVLALLGAVMHEPWLYAGFGFTGPIEGFGASLALFFLVLPVFTFALTPLTSRTSRKNEFQADAFAARTSNAQFLIAALVKLYNDNGATLTPDPLYSLLYDSHPGAMARVAHLEQLGAGGA